PEVADRRDEGDVLPAHALAEKAHQGERDERRQQREIESLWAEQISPGFRSAHLPGDLGGKQLLCDHARTVANGTRGAVDGDRGARHGVDVAADPERIAKRLALELRRELRRLDPEKAVRLRTVGHRV